MNTDMSVFMVPMVSAHGQVPTLLLDIRWILFLACMASIFIIIHLIYLSMRNIIIIQILKCLKKEVSPFFTSNKIYRTFCFRDD